ncbi:para-nitrobenzyl esterase [Tamaricihabitans halophyticus]|uniref:Carboxylic ester hydrolase n=1 Tax=Tamaricihabitans halophyticus TaxID=1262583 RepID=A0A4R2R6M8_9PSEU|nr:carboxylesterase family protein [Tamaricihabitans halophyticus]TCP57519.1 para-nitrobenzyl esterase [Tamaricihabitans halophyticus]
MARNGKRQRWYAAAGTAVLAGLSIATGTANAAPVAPETPDAPLTVRTDTGALRGASTDKARTFQNVPYAQPPVGELRWKPPQPVNPWQGVRDATKQGERCAQQPPGGEVAGSEDCLYLDVTTPRKQAPNAKLPVMVWWHGGGFTRDSKNDYNAERLADQANAVVVTVNYRLGIFGYFGLPGLAGSGNFGFADQIAALEWANRNAESFGGDSNNVTVFGQSAGSMSACALLTSPKAPGLVDKAALSSGSCKLDWPTGALFPGDRAHAPYLPVQEGQAKGRDVARELGCAPGKELSCMREKSTGELIPRMQDFADSLAYGTSLLPLNPSTALDIGKFARVPVLSGSTRDEARSFVAGAMLVKPDAVTSETYPKLLREAFGADAAAVEARYPLSDYPSAGLAWSTVVTDQSWACQTAEGNRELAKYTTVYPYQFADPNAPNVNQLFVPEVPQEAAHGTDLPYLFDLGGVDLLKEEPQRELGRTMVDYWASFAHTGNPNNDPNNNDEAPYWPELNEANPTAMRLAPGATEPIDFAAEHNCGFWRTIG